MYGYGWLDNVPVGDDDPGDPDHSMWDLVTDRSNGCRYTWLDAKPQPTPTPQKIDCVPQYDEWVALIASNDAPMYIEDINSQHSLMNINFQPAVPLGPITLGAYVYHMPNPFPGEIGLADVYRMFIDPEEGLEDVHFLFTE